MIFPYPTFFSYDDSFLIRVIAHRFDRCLPQVSLQLQCHRHFIVIFRWWLFQKHSVRANQYIFTDRFLLNVHQENRYSCQLK